MNAIERDAAGEATYIRTSKAHYYVHIFRGTMSICTFTQLLTTVAASRGIAIAQRVSKIDL